MYKKNKKNETVNNLADNRLRVKLIKKLRKKTD